MKNGKADTQPTAEEIRLANLPPEELQMREAAAIVASVVGLVSAKVAPGVKLTDLELEAAKLIKQFGAEPYNLGYKPVWARTPYPAILCTSVNDCIAHGIPTEYELKEGDTVCIDLGIKFNGACGDCAITVPVGEIDEERERLLEKAKKALYVGINKVKAGVLVTEIAKAIEQYANSVGYVTNRVFTGHEIGKEMHGTGLLIPSFYVRNDKDYLMTFGGRTLKAGQVICLEPMLTEKDKVGKLAADGWGVNTKDGKPSAMFEHMILVTENGYEILTDHFIKD